jgi:hypothetical protein
MPLYILGVWEGLRYSIRIANQVWREARDMDKERSSNDQKSDVNNPTSEEHKASNDNRSNQMNPNNPEHHSSRGKK